MAVLIIIAAALALFAVCFILVKHKNKLSARRVKGNEFEQLEILLQNIEAYGKSTASRKKGGGNR